MSNGHKRPFRNVRWYVALMLCLSSELNYLDRQTLSVLADTIQRELNLTTIDYSRITSSFLISYAVMYAVSGKLVDILGTRRAFMIFVSSWSIANMLHAFANSALQFRLYRLILGAAEPANFPAGVKAVSEWFPMRERALAVGIFNAGTALGSALAVPLVSWIALTWGWRYAFVMTGAVGFIWVAVWSMFYEVPEKHPRLSDAEKMIILSDARPEDDNAAPVSIGRLLRMRETWGCILARVLTDPISYFLFFWTPKYFQQERGFNLADVGTYIWIPYAALTVGNISSGAIPRCLISRGWSVNRARKSTMLVVSCLMPIFCLLVTRVSAPTVAILIMTAIMFGHAAWGNITLPAEVFPKHVVGTVSGFGGALGAVVGAVTQWYIGNIVETFSFAPIFAACAVMYLLAFGLVHWLIGELGSIRPLAASEKNHVPAQAL
jgi:ACS family hexuronate transporter-like MFS transporter